MKPPLPAPRGRQPLPPPPPPSAAGRLRSPQDAGRGRKARQGRGCPAPGAIASASARLPRRRGGPEPGLSPRRRGSAPAASPRSPRPGRNRRRAPAARETPSSAGTCPCQPGLARAQPPSQEGGGWGGTGRGLWKGPRLAALPPVRAKAAASGQRDSRAVHDGAVGS